MGTTTTTSDLLPVRDIREDGTIALADGRDVALFRIQGHDVHTANPGEALAFLGALVHLLNGCRWPLHLVVPRRPATAGDLTAPLLAIRDNPRAPAGVRAYAATKAEHLGAQATAGGGLFPSRYYLSVAREHADATEALLRQCGLHPTRLGPGAALEVEHLYWRGARNLRATDETWAFSPNVDVGEVVWRDGQARIRAVPPAATAARRAGGRDLDLAAHRDPPLSTSERRRLTEPPRHAPLPGRPSLLRRLLAAVRG